MPDRLPFPMSDVAFRALLSEAGLPRPRRRFVRVRARRLWLKLRGHRG